MTSNDIKIKLELTIEEMYYLRFALGRAKQMAEEQIPQMKEIVDKYKQQKVADRYMEISEKLRKEQTRQLKERWGRC